MLRDRRGALLGRALVPVVVGDGAQPVVLRVLVSPSTITDLVHGRNARPLPGECR